MVVRPNISSTTLSFTLRENFLICLVLSSQIKRFSVFIPWDDEVDRTEVLKWMQKSHTRVGILF